MSSSEAISPTAHYTGYVWARNGLSHPQLATIEGRALFESLRPAMIVSHALGGGTLEEYLLARHRAIDAPLPRRRCWSSPRPAKRCASRWATTPCGSAAVSRPALA